MVVEVRTDGCVRLGDSVVCDGFQVNCPIRIQTHAHVDHMAGFESSKKHQRRIVLSEPTFDLLALEQADIEFRNPQFVKLPIDGSRHNVLGTSIELYPSGHMVGSCMPVVESEGQRLMYSSDFGWPLSLIPENIDVLVIDSTYGDPALQRTYSNEEAITAFLDTFDRIWADGPVLIVGHRGRLQYACQLIASRVVHAPLLFSRHIANSIEVYGKWQGFNVEAIDISTIAGGRIIRSGKKFVAFVEERDREEVVGLDLSPRIWLSRFSMPNEEVVVEYPSGLIRVAMTDHADFRGTIALIEAVRPKFVHADGSRGGDCDALAHYVREELGIGSSSRITKRGPGWGE